VRIARTAARLAAPLNGSVVICRHVKRITTYPRLQIAVFGPLSFERVAVAVERPAVGLGHDALGGPEEVELVGGDRGVHIRHRQTGLSHLRGCVTSINCGIGEVRSRGFRAPSRGCAAM